MAAGGTFAAFWRERFGDVRPEGPELRRFLPERWLRIHSLPQSKRYPDDDSERALLVASHAEAADAILGAEGPCWLSIVIYNSDRPEREADPGYVPEAMAFTRAFQLDHAMSGAMPIAEWGADDPPTFRVFAAATSWDASRFQDTLLDVAEKRLDDVLWTSIATGAVYAPYDGGADLFLPDVSARDHMAERFKAWRSPRPDGL